MLKAKKGRLLISEPSLSDKTFFKSVILLTYHSPDESIGLILNRPTNVSINEILNDIPSSDFPVYIGGPVAKNSIQFIFSRFKIHQQFFFGLKGPSMVATNKKGSIFVSLVKHT